MTSFSPDDLIASPVEIVGALDFDRREHGLSPRRLPHWTRPQVPALLDVMVRMPSGVRLAFRTNSPGIRLETLTTNMVMPGRPERPVAFDLVVDGETISVTSDKGNRLHIDPDDPASFRVERGEPDTISFENLGNEMKTCELWLPHNVFVELRSLTFDEGSRIESPAPLQNRWVHYGSSISHCMEATHPTGTWPAVAALAGNQTLYSLGFGGQCHLDQFVARTIREVEADFISIKCGINVVNLDSMRERAFVPALHGFLDTIRERRPTTPILVASPIYCPSAENRPGPTIANEDGKFVTLTGHEAIQDGCLTLTRIRELIEDIVGRRDDPHLGYLNGLELFGEDDAGDLPDDLHPSPAGYKRMGRRFADRVFADGGLLSRL